MNHPTPNSATRVLADGTYRCTYDFKDHQSNKQIVSVLLNVSMWPSIDDLIRIDLTYAGKSIWSLNSDMTANKINMFRFWIDKYHVDCIRSNAIQIDKICPILANRYCWHIARHFKLHVDYKHPATLTVEYESRPMKKRLVCLRHYRHQYPRVKFYKPMYVGEFSIDHRAITNTHYMPMNCEYNVLDIVLIISDPTLASDFLIRSNNITLTRCFKSDIYHIEDGSMRRPMSGASKADASSIASPDQVHPINIRGDSIELEAWCHENKDATIDVIAIEVVNG